MQVTFAGPTMKVVIAGPNIQAASIVSENAGTCPVIHLHRPSSSVL
jgi:hypothetical protein